MQREHEVNEIEAEDELEAVRGHGEGQRGDVQPHGLANQDSEEEQRLQRGQQEPHDQIVRLSRLSEIIIFLDLITFFKNSTDIKLPIPRRHDATKPVA